ncbi:unnamed protein product, partial [Gulo gulo]
RTQRNPLYPARSQRHHRAKRSLPVATCTEGTPTTPASPLTCLLPTWPCGAPRPPPGSSPRLHLSLGNLGSQAGGMGCLF